MTATTPRTSLTDLIASARPNKLIEQLVADAAPAPRRRTLADALNVETSSFFRSLAALPGAAASR